MAKVTQRHVVCKVEPYYDPITRRKVSDGWTATSGSAHEFFSQVSGGEIQAQVEKVFDGGQIYPETLAGPSEVGDITVTRHWDPVVDGPYMARYRKRVGRVRFNLSIFTLNGDLTVPGTARIYEGALLVNISEPEGDASSGTPATFALTFAVGRVHEGRVSRA